MYVHIYLDLLSRIEVPSLDRALALFILKRRWNSSFIVKRDSQTHFSNLEIMNVMPPLPVS